MKRRNSVLFATSHLVGGAIRSSFGKLCFRIALNEIFALPLSLSSNSNSNAHPCENQKSNAPTLPLTRPHTCTRSRFSERSTHRRCKSRHLRSNRVLQGGHAIKSRLQIRAERADYARIEPPSMHVPCVQPACGPLQVGPRANASSACTAVQESRCSAASARALPLPTPTARS